MSKVEKPAAPAKSKKMLIIVVAIISAIVLLVVGGAVAWLLLKPSHSPFDEKPAEEASAKESHAKETPAKEMAAKFFELGTFTANLIHEEGDRYLQVTISLKVVREGLEENIKANKPEILHRVNMLLQSKRPSELATFDGKEKLAQQIKGQVEYVLGLRKIAPLISDAQSNTSATRTSAEPAEIEVGKGIADVLFTSFIIQ